MTEAEIIAELRKQPGKDARWTVIRLKERDKNPGILMWINEETANLLLQLKWQPDEYGQYFHEVHFRPLREEDKQELETSSTTDIIAPGCILDIDIGQKLDVVLDSIFGSEKVKPLWRRYGELKLSPAESGIMLFGHPENRYALKVGFQQINDLFKPHKSLISTQEMLQIFKNECDTMFCTHIVQEGRVSYLPRPNQLEYVLEVPGTELLEEWQKQIEFKNDFFERHNKVNKYIKGNYCKFIWGKIRGHLTAKDGEVFKKALELGGMTDKDSLDKAYKLAKEIENDINAGSYKLGHLNYNPPNLSLYIKLFFNQFEKNRLKAFLYGNFYPDVIERKDFEVPIQMIKSVIDITSLTDLRSQLHYCLNNFKNNYKEDSKKANTGTSKNLIADAMAARRRRNA